MADQFQKAFPVSWDQLHRDAKALAWRLAEPGPWWSVIAVTRGGLVPAAIVAAGEPRELQLPPRWCCERAEHQHYLFSAEDPLAGLPEVCGAAQRS